MDVSVPAVNEDRITPTAVRPETLEYVLPLRPQARELAERALQAIGEPDDKSRRYLVLGLLVEPRLADRVLPLAIAMDAPEPGDPEWRRRLRAADGAPQSIIRGGAQAVSALHRNHGVRDTTLPARPTTHRPSAAHGAFIDHVASRRAVGGCIQHCPGADRARGSKRR